MDRNLVVQGFSLDIILEAEKLRDQIGGVKRSTCASWILIHLKKFIYYVDNPNGI